LFLTFGSIRRLVVCGLCLLPLAACYAPGDETRPAAPAVTSAPANPAPTFLLKPALRLERELKAGEVQAFEIALEADQTLDLVVDQQGGDVVVTLLDPQGEQLLRVDNPSGADGSEGPERVVWVSEKPASYRLTVSGFGAQGGHYTILLAEVRSATESDRVRATAELTMSEADLLYNQDRRRCQQTIGKYEAALAAFQALGDRSREADALYRLGRSWQGLGASRQALEAYERARDFYEETENERQQAITLHNLCSIYKSEYELEKALDRCQRALLLWQRVGDRMGRAKSSNMSGFIFRRLAEGHRALTFYDQALGLWRELGERSQEARDLHNRGRVYASLGKPKQALADLSQALAIQRNLGEEDRIPITLNGLAYVYASRGETEKALESLTEALELQGTEIHYRRAITLNCIAWIHFLSGKTEEALEEYRRAGKIFHIEGKTAWEAQTLADIGRVFASQNQPQEALNHFRRALPLFAAIRQRSGKAQSLLGIAAAERQRGNLEAARETIEEALLLVEDLRTRSAVASSDLRAYYFATKQHYYDFYIDLLMELHRASPWAGHDREALAASERARARSLLEILTEGGRDFEHGADPTLLERERNLERRINAKELQLVWLLENSAAEQQVRRVEGEQQDLLREYEWVRGQIRLSSPHYASLTQPVPLYVDALQRQVPDDETILLWYKLGEKRSFLWAVTPDSITSFVLPPRARIEDLTRHAYDLISEDKRQARQRVQKDLAELSDMLLSPVVALLREKERLLVISEGALRVLPWSALPTPAITSRKQASAVPLVTSYEIIALPSASALAALRAKLADRPPAPKTLAVLADPVFGSEDPRLAASQRRTEGGPPEPNPVPSGERSGDPESLPRLVYSGLEAKTILALVPAESRLEALGFDANREVVESGELGRYRIVHFATHGHLNAEHPELSRLMLSQVDEQGKARDDGFLHAYEIYRLKLSAELVVLSACQTALGPQIPGEGLMGLTRAFLHAGSARVVVSLWKVNDRATAELMGRFYQHLLVDKMPPAAALRAAQDFIRREKRWRAPYYWAGFVLQGEWRDIRR